MEGWTVSLSCGTQMPVIGLGTWQSKPEEIKLALTSALDAGYTHIDTAYMYGNEEAIGEVLKEKIESGAVKRDDIFITTKLWNTFHARNDVRLCLEESLKRLNLDYVDLYLIHSPFSMKNIPGNLTPKDDKGRTMFDYTQDLTETWKGMEDLVDAGLTKAIGLSNFNQKQIEDILSVAKIPPANLQVECHADFLQTELHEFCKSKGISFTAYAPLGSPGRTASSTTEDAINLFEEPIVLELSKKHRKSPAQILLRHLIQLGIIVIPKSVTPKRILENIQVFDFELSSDDMAKMASIKKGTRQFQFRRGNLYGGAEDHPNHPFKCEFT